MLAPPNNEPAAPGGDFCLVDDRGREVTLETYRGRCMLVFFGFTHCRAVCPRKLAQLTEVLQQLGSSSELFVPLYISVDPERDSPERMRTFLAETAPRFTGLTGTRAQVDGAKAAFGVFARRKNESDGYSVPHTAITYVLGPEGRYATHFLDGASTAQMTDSLRAIVERYGLRASV